MKFAPELLIEQMTRQLLEAFIKDPSHGILLAGDEGVGLSTIAQALGAGVYPSGSQHILAPEDGKEITIDQVRLLYTDTKSIHEDGLVVIIDDCDQMSIPAQNALLKLLEEPPHHTLFILTTHNPGSLLPTITSRVSSIDVKRISSQDSAAFINELTNDSSKKAQIAFLAEGKPAEISRLASDDETLQAHAGVIRDARAFIQGSKFERLILINSYASREGALQFINALAGLSLFAQRRGESVAAKQFEFIATATDNIHDNAQVKLQLIKLALTL